MTSIEPIWKTTEHDRRILRELAARFREIAESPINLERKRLWTAHNDLRESRPLILIESFPATDAIVTKETIQCEADWARRVEETLRVKIAHHEYIDDDDAYDPFFETNWRVNTGDYGVSGKPEYSGTRARADRVEGSYRWEPPIKNIARDFDKLRQRQPTVDRESTLAWKAHLESVFGDVLPVRIRGGFWWTTGMTITAVNLIGLEQLMLYMYDDPDGLHRIMAFLRDDQIALDEWLESEGLLTLNNEGDYIGSGSRGYTSGLPGDGYTAGSPARLRDLWVLSESQETVGVGPTQFAEFIFPYQKAVTERYGLLYYGCCEPVHSRWEVLKQFENLRSVSVSPWANESYMGEALGRKYVYSRKPNPTLVSTPQWDEDAIRDDVRTTLDAARGCNIELVMKDVHTFSGHPERAARWVALTREVIREYGWDA